MEATNLMETKKALLNQIEWVKENEIEEDGVLSFSIIDLEDFIVGFNGNVGDLLEIFFHEMANKGYDEEDVKALVKLEINF